jgi:hypothetical protein
MRARWLALRVAMGLCTLLAGVLCLWSSAVAAVVVVTREYSAAVGTTTATIKAEIDPGGLDTTYHFEYDTSEYSSSAQHGTSVPVPDGDIGVSERTVSESLTGLHAGTTYHYRVVATNADGTIEGPDRTFFTAPVSGPAEADGCPNARLRLGTQSEGLPECRAYEMVTPLDKNGSDIEGQAQATIAAANGERLTFAARAGFADTSGSGDIGMTQYVASRGEGGWTSRGVTPTPSQEAYQLLVAATRVVGVSEQLDHALVSAYDLPYTHGGVPKAENLYRESNADGALETLTTPLGSEQLSILSRLGESPRAYSADMGVVTFETPYSMIPETDGLPLTNKLYAWEEGMLKLVGILPDGTIPAGGSSYPVPNVGLCCEELGRSDTVSRDGSRILFVATPEGGSSPQLYMRKDASSTVWVSQSEASTPNPEPQSVVFETASRDLKEVLFMSTDRLTDSDPGSGGGGEYGLYLYTDGPKPEGETNLTFITRINLAGTPPQDAVYGMSEDGARVYFGSFQTAQLPGAQGTYLWDKGTVHTVTTRTIEPEAPHFDLVRRVSSDGRVFAFTEERGRIGVGDTGLFNAMYVYDEDSEALRCASCPPSGAAVTSEVEIDPHATNDNLKALLLPEHPHLLTADGRLVFFSTADALVPQDTNGLYDVYAYDTETGKVSLLSPGSGGSGSWFTDASADGRDVFFATRESLTGWDIDDLVDLYDVRVGGGFPEPPPQVEPCLGDACHGVPSTVPTFNTASGFSGLGNVLPVPAATKQKQKPKKAKERVKHRKHGHARARRHKAARSRRGHHGARG